MITYNKKSGRVIDFIYSLYFIFNKDYEEHFMKLNADPNKNVTKAIAALSKKADINNKKVHLFFEKKTLLAESFIDYKTITYMESSKDFVKYIKSLSKTQILKCIISDLKETKPELITDAEVNEIMNNMNLLLSLAEQSKVSDEFKWILVMYLNNLDSYMDEIINFMDDYSDYFEVFMDKNKYLNKFSEDLEKKISEGQERFINEVLNNVISFEDKSEIFVTPVFFNSCSLMPYHLNDRSLLFMGIDFENTIKKFGGTDELDKKISIYNCLSDKTRFKLLKLISQERLFSRELAERLSISVGTVTYHMNFLLSSNLVTIQREGQKTFYNFNSSVLKEACSFLKINFKL